MHSNHYESINTNAWLVKTNKNYDFTKPTSLRTVISKEKVEKGVPLLQAMEYGKNPQSQKNRITMRCESREPKKTSPLCLLHLL